MKEGAEGDECIYASGGGRMREGGGESTGEGEGEGWRRGKRQSVN